MLITRFYFIEDEDEDFCVFSADWPKKGGGQKYLPSSA